MPKERLDDDDDDDDDEEEEEEQKPEAEREERNPRVDALFFKSRNVLITGEINDKVARQAVTHLLALSEASDEPINLFISSPGGHVESGDMVHDIVKFIRPTVRAIGSGWVASAGALIFIGAERENRFCLPNTRFLLHQPRGGDLRPGERHVDPGRADPEDARALRPAVRRGDRPDAGEDRRGHGAGLLAEHRRGAWRYGLLGRVITSIDDLK